jgi:chemotaxis response regulator CheB
VEERRAPVDIFFRTLADAHRARAVGVVLSGTGANGSLSCYTPCVMYCLMPNSQF